ncbi:MAG: lipocalin family protein [Pseudomonadota bacterium]
MIRAFALAALVVLAACSPSQRDTSIEMTTVQDVDLERYSGLWYEIARYPNFFERGCEGATAEYGVISESRISVVNTCRRDGERTGVEGFARVVAPGQLEVKFAPDWLPEFLPVWGDYWIIGLEEDYSVVTVGSPSGRYGWILARSPAPDPAAMDRARATFERFGYDLSGLEYPPL